MNGSQGTGDSASECIHSITRHIASGSQFRKSLYVDEMRRMVTTPTSSMRDYHTKCMRRPLPNDGGTIIASDHCGSPASRRGSTLSTQRGGLRVRLHRQCSGVFAAPDDVLLSTDASPASKIELSIFFAWRWRLKLRRRTSLSLKQMSERGARAGHHNITACCRLIRAEGSTRPRLRGLGTGVNPSRQKRKREGWGDEKSMPRYDEN